MCTICVVIGHQTGHDAWVYLHELKLSALGYSSRPGSVSGSFVRLCSAIVDATISIHPAKSSRRTIQKCRICVRTKFDDASFITSDTTSRFASFMQVLMRHLKQLLEIPLFVV